ncbi:MAG: glycosyltransferase family 4 protein [Thermodesulfobacteriota bacterium]
MTRDTFSIHFLLAAFLFFLSCGICMLIIRRLRIMDIPNERSSHDRPVPKSGGVALVSAFLIGVAAIVGFGESLPIGGGAFVGFVLAAVLIAAISLYDDIRSGPFFVKLAGQMAAVAVLMYFGLVLTEISLPGFGRMKTGPLGWLISCLWILGLTNAYNFMDGLNGMAAGTAVIAASFFSFVSYQQGSTVVYIIGYSLIAGSLGFLVFNFPGARLFMGDVGSAFLGFVFATLAIIGAAHESAHTSFLVMPLLLFHFIFDTSFTFIRRLLRRENVFAAHRTHLYQLFNQLGSGHVFVSSFHFAVCMVQGAGACYLVTIEGGRRLLVFIPYLIFQTLYAVIIMGKARKAGLLATSDSAVRSGSVQESHT